MMDVDNNNEQLRRENDNLRTYIMDNMMFPERWGLSRRESKLLMAIYKADGSYCSHEALRASASLHNDDIAKVYIAKIRDKLDRFGIVIESVHGKGYRLASGARTIIKEVMA